MCYRDDETADFVGLQRVEGNLGERSGSFVLTSNGTFDGKVAAGEMRSRRRLRHRRARGSRAVAVSRRPHGSEAAVELDYSIS